MIGLFAFSFTSFAQTRAPFPESLFEVKLGSLHTIGQGTRETDVGTLPVKEIKGVQQFLGSGQSLYFKPLKTYAAFEYAEDRKKPEDRHFGTTFRLYVLPVFPQDAATLKEEVLAKQLRWEVALIEWTQKETAKDGPYYWAKDLCKSLNLDLSRESKVWDDFAMKPKHYMCTFEEGDRELRVQALGDLKIFQLKYTEPAFKKKDEAADAVLRKLQMNSIRPYK
jgi:hypothetical protein